MASFILLPLYQERPTGLSATLRNRVLRRPLNNTATTVARPIEIGTHIALTFRVRSVSRMGQ